MKNRKSQNPLLFVPLVFGVLLCSSCARSTLTLDDGSRHLTPVLGSEAEDIRFINHVVFSKVEKEAEKVVFKKVGVLAVTTSDVILTEGNASSITSEEVERIPLAEIEGAAVSGPFLQVVYKDQRYVMLPYRWYIDTVDMEKLNALADLMEELAVPTVAAAEIDWIRRRIHNAEGGGVHVVGTARQGGYAYAPEYWDGGGSYNGDGTPRDSQAFTPWQEWGK